MKKLSMVSLQDKAEQIATKMGDKILRPKLEKASIAQQVAYARRIMKLSGINEMRKNMINGFEHEFIDALKKNPEATYEELTAKYLSCEEWVKFWNDLDLNETHLEVLYNNAKEYVQSKQNDKEITDRARNFPKKHTCPIVFCNKSCKRIKGTVSTYSCNKHGEFTIGRQK